MKLLKVVQSLPLLVLYSSAVNAEEISVSGATIFYTNTQAVSYSEATNETMIERAGGAPVQINVSKHIVVRGESEKISFTPLQAKSAELTDMSLRARSVAGIDLPEAFRAVSTLHLRFASVAGQSNRKCEVLILDNLLFDADKTQLRSLLLDQKVSFETNNGYLRAQCASANGVDK